MFRTRDEPAADLIGLVVGFQQWWMPDAFDAVADVSRRWVLEPAPAPEHHEHCLLDWTTIEIGGEASVGYRSDEDWICPACYDHSIVNDHVGIRR